MDSLYSFLLMAHSGWRWVVLVLLVITTIKVLIGWVGNQQWAKVDTNLVRFSNIAISIQFVLGLILYILFLILGIGAGRIVSFSGGHVVPAILAVAAVGFAAARSRKASGSKDKFKMASIGFVLALIFLYGALATVGGIFV